MSKAVCHTKEECREMYAALPEEKKETGRKVIREALDADDFALFRGLIAKHGKEEWFWHLYDAEIKKLSANEKTRGLAMLYNPHFQFGMSLRNFLRQNGCGEEFFGIHNLDDIYIELLTEAVSGETLDTR